MEGGGFLDDVDRLAEAEAAAAAEAAGDEVAAPHRAGCTQCASLSWDPDWLRTFGMRLCKQCQRQEKLVAKVGGAGGAWAVERGGLPGRGRRV